jgi:hypothetical protein
MELGIETIGIGISFILTLMVYCYLGKDIPFLYAIYRIAAYLFVGVALGYGAVMAWHGVVVPRLLVRLEGGEWWYVAPLLLCLLLITRVRRAWSGLSAVPIAFVFGVGAALAVGGGVVGTLLPQVEATFLSLSPAHYQGLAAREGELPATYALNAVLIVIGTISTLLYFYFTTGARTGESSSAPGKLAAAGANLRDRIVRLSTGFGKVFIMFTLGALFATAAISYISLLVDRVRFIIDTLWSYL